MSQDIQALVAILGGKTVLEKDVKGYLDLYKLIGEEGLPYGVIPALATRLNLPVSRIPVYMDRLSARTLVRRKDEGRLSSAESEQVVTLALGYLRVTQALDHLGHQKRVLSWLKRPNRRTLNQPPLKLLASWFAWEHMEMLLEGELRGVIELQVMNE